MSAPPLTVYYKSLMTTWFAFLGSASASES